MINLFDFENADIGKLAIVLAEAWRPRPAEAVQVITGAAGFTAYAGYGVLLGFAFTDTSAAANTLSVHDGADVNGPLLASHTVAASTSATLPMPVPGVRIERGLTIASTGPGAAVLYFVRHVRHD